MSGLVPVAALLVIAGKVDIDGTLVSETRGGEVPLVAGQPSTLTVAEVLTPGVVAQVADHRFSLRLDYGLRIFWSKSVGIPVGQPLLLNVINLAALVRLSHRTSLTGHANASFGAADYTFLPQILTTNRSTTLQAVDFLSLSGGIGGQVRASPIWTFQSLLDAAHRRPIGDSAAPPTDATTQVVFPRQTLIQGSGSGTARVSHVDEVILETRVAYQATSGALVFSQGGQLPSSADFSIFTVSTLVGWRARLAPRRTLRLGAGFAYNDVSVSVASAVRNPPITPVAAAELDTRLWSHHDAALRLLVATSVDYFVDPLLGTGGPRGRISSSVLLGLRPDWTAELLGSFATSLSPRSTDPAALYPDETILNVSLPVRHYISENLIGEFGARYIHSAPRIAAPDFHFHQLQVWLYVMLTATSRPVTRRVAP